MGTFGSLSIPASGMQAAQTALNVISQNIANANTPGYKRQQVVLVEGNPPTGYSVSHASPNSVMGGGVQVLGIRRVQDAYLDSRIADSTQSFNQWSTTHDLLSSLEANLGEPGANGISALLDDFWNQWRGLAASPAGLSGRVAVIASADALAGRIKEVYSNISELRDQLNVTISNRIDEINRIARDIAEVNTKIVNFEVTGAAPNDLLDRRDTLVENLSQIVGVQTHGETGRDFILNVGGVSLVQGTASHTILKVPDTQGHIRPTWDEGSGEVEIGSGELKGILNVRDGYIPDYLSRLDNIASTIVTEVNALHAAGYTVNGQTGQNFFAPGATAITMQVDPAIMQDPSLVVASANGEESNAEVAQSIADLVNRPLIRGETITESYRTLVNKVGGDVSIAQRSAATRQFTLQQLTQQRDSVSGVNLDEEMIEMVKFQHAFAASARVFEATNSILQSLFDSVRV
ncbi:MAG: flagellar hook-associated protein FlgK [Armatimonadetes bacterium]|nr:flagellar hook-associated protein FlgK [Armatimonadota bacterium]